ncbi:HupE/UreJ family protein [Anabaena sp. PCC 7108]|uniref:HupE/UreJ family protein n=1 Tax=Anabaena sp. PCC 7108 TaxID=163908 RepID=UPI000345C069|nr:HupE/UreJ family protein [Anabaena sp. PCC 7108]
MFKIPLTASSNLRKLPVSRQYRHIGAIAALVLISLLSSSGGVPVAHTISNSWEGLIWGIADPVIALDRLAGIVAIGLLAARFGRGAWIGASFVIAALCGQIIHLYQLNLLGTEIAIAIFTIAFGIILVQQIQLSWLVIAIVSAAAGLFQGYADGESILGAGIVTVVTYIIGVTLTQSVIFLCSRESGAIMGGKEIQPILASKIRWAGLAFCGIGIVFLGKSFI